MFAHSCEYRRDDLSLECPILVFIEKFVNIDILHIQVITSVQKVKTCLNTLFHIGCQLFTLRALKNSPLVVISRNSMPSLARSCF